MNRSVGSRVWGFSKKMMRLSAYFAAVSVVSLAIAGRIAYGRAKDVALSTGEDLIRLTEAGQVGDRMRLRLNGELVLLSSASTDAPVEAVLDHFQGECQEHADGIVDEFTHLRTAIQSGAKPLSQGWPGVGLLRKSEREYGVVLCFAQGGPTTTPEAYKHVAEFAKTGDLSKIGSIRYVVAKKTENGTHVVALWTEGAFEMKKMFPDVGDAPGNDPKDAMRPELSRRVLTAYAEGAPYGIRVYESNSTPQELLEQYDAMMPKLGWLGYPDVTKATPNSRAFSRNDIDMIVTVDKQTDHTMVSIVEMGTK